MKIEDKYKAQLQELGIWQEAFASEIHTLAMMERELRRIEKVWREAQADLKDARQNGLPEKDLAKAVDAHYALIRELCDEFRAETGSIICRELLGLAPAQSDPPVSEARTPAYYNKRPCAELVALAAGILAKRLGE